MKESGLIQRAAMIVAILRSSPPSGSRTRYLRLADATTSYSPVCQSFAPIVFKDLHELNLLSGGDMKVVKEALVEACRITTDE